MVSLTIPGSLPSLNEYIRLERANKWGAAAMKKEATELVAATASGMERVEGPAVVSFRWFVKNRRMDPDNVVFAKKFVLDGLVLAGVLENDSMAHIAGLYDEVAVDRENPRVEVEIVAA